MRDIAWRIHYIERMVWDIEMTAWDIEMTAWDIVLIVQDKAMTEEQRKKQLTDKRLKAPGIDNNQLGIKASVKGTELPVRKIGKLAEEIRENVKKIKCRLT